MYELTVYVPTKEHSKMLSNTHHAKFEKLVLSIFDNLTCKETTRTCLSSDEQQTFLLYTIMVKSAGDGDKVDQIKQFTMSHYSDPALYFCYLA